MYGRKLSSRVRVSRRRHIAVKLVMSQKRVAATTVMNYNNQVCSLKAQTQTTLYISRCLASMLEAKQYHTAATAE